MPAKKKDFETSMTKLEAIVSELESGEFSLAESLAMFEEGLLLGKSCRELLDNAEARVTQLLDEPDADDTSDADPQSQGEDELF